jgi:hypothetical protein
MVASEAAKVMKGIITHSCMAVSIRSGLTAPEGALEPRPNIDMVVCVGTEAEAEAK